MWSDRDYRPNGFLRPCLLLLLAEQPEHGYELAEQLEHFGFANNPGGVYRALHEMEVEGLVSARHVPSDSGPDRRRYRITASGLRSLDEATQGVSQARTNIDLFLYRNQAMLAGREERRQRRKRDPS